ncbi:PREDICTED: uncharacterized protein LOC104610919 [Nelumbo nucifera]|uniref:Uncharacterized protein n=2 Tax=Nelumbo nucifera TaxID=4432 RepID=A0A822XKG6_NELNU|nr:PREDICTED: uncharacterized protein LOC104610919 [Nelumbo nucifera]DAD20502.1 TPA_asm: hypothetical protein HUJ06_021965 [Nelumbo nucifera]
MWNCLKPNKVVAGGEIQTPTPAESSQSVRPKEGRDGAVGARFKSANKTVVVDEESKGDAAKSRSNGVVRLKLVVTQQELNQLLSYKKECKHFSAEQLLNLLKLRSRRRIALVRVRDDDNSAWRPSLESIPEDHFSV